MGAPGAFTPPPSSPPTHTPKLLSLLRRLDSLVDWERRTRGGSLPGSMRLLRTSTSPSLALLSRLGTPQRSFSAIHVTGSKGKGSVACLLTAALLHAPYLRTVVGTYASPHVERINERVRLNARPIPDDDLADALRHALDVRERAPVIHDATWFDVMCAAAFVAFRRAGVRWAVVEVGMGGRLDSTNVLRAPVVVVTNVHLEHAEIIGPTTRDVAYEKAGIIAGGAHVVSGLAEVDALAHVFEDEARKQTPCATVEFCGRAEMNTGIFERNLKVARAAMREVARREGVEGLAEEELLPERVAREALRGLPARQEEFRVGGTRGRAEVRVLLDGAHVPESVELVLQEGGFGFGRGPVVVLGVGREKNVKGICESVQKIGPCYVFATAAGMETPYMRAGQLAEVMRAAGGGRVEAVEEAEEAMNRAIQMAEEEGRDVVVVGSLHLAGKVRRLLRRKQDLHMKQLRSLPRMKAVS